MEAKFTKGPWSACCEKNPDSPCGLVFGDGGDVFVAQSLGPADVTEWDPVPRQEQASANKALIAAAPDLYDALERWAALGQKFMPNRADWDADEVAAYESTLAALAKARGEQPAGGA